MTGFNLSAGHDGLGWNFNPFAWQFLYTIGIVTGHFSKVGFETGSRSAIAINGHGSRWRPASPSSRCLRRRRGAAAKRAERCSTSTCGRPKKPSSRRCGSRMSSRCSIYLRSLCRSRRSSFPLAPRASFLACGRNSLPVYGVGVVLSCAGYVALSESDATNMTPIAVNVLGIFSLFVLACALDWRRKNSRSSEGAYASASARKVAA